MSQKQTLAPLEKLISYFAGYDSLAHFTPKSVEKQGLLTATASVWFSEGCNFAFFSLDCTLTCFFRS